MAISKRTRYEVLRRDDHTCQYCGAKAPDVTLHIDHVMPVALGGDDKPGNLLTACKDCNSGKSSVMPDSPLVEGLNERAAAYALGMMDKMTRFKAGFESLDEYEADFLEIWNGWQTPANEPVALPPDYALSLYRWMQIGIPTKAFELAIPKAMTKRSLRGEFGVFTYMAGIVTRMLDAQEIDLSVTEESAAFYTKSEGDDLQIDGYMQGTSSERRRIKQLDTALDVLRNLIDGTEPETQAGFYTGKVVKIGEGSRTDPD